jgi:hypothetical protein
MVAGAVTPVRAVAVCVVAAGSLGEDGAPRARADAAALHGSPNVDGGTFEPLVRVRASGG